MASKQRSSSHPLLRAMVPEHRAVLLQGAQDQVFEPGAVLFREGQPANRLYLVQEGHIALETHVRGQGDIIMATIGPGQVLGWSWLVPPYVWHFQARALESAKVIVLDGGHLLIASEQNHYLGYELMKNISRVILDVLLSAHERWMATGHRPKLDKADPLATVSLDRTASLDTRIAELPFFHGLQPAYVQMLAQRATSKEYEPDQMVFEAGDPADGLFVLEQGRFTIEAVREQERIPVQTIRPGEAIGWSSFCEPYEWQFAARAFEPSFALFFSAADLRERCAADYHFGYELTKRITRMMLKRLQSTRSRMWEAFRPDP
jgi:CRP/FNR family transcriptional regulator, cyclic AMP receptor protein